MEEKRQNEENSKEGQEKKAYNNESNSLYLMKRFHDT